MMLSLSLPRYTGSTGGTPLSSAEAVVVLCQDGWDGMYGKYGILLLWLIFDVLMF